MKFEVDGRVAPGFEAVMDVFEKNFSDDIEVGASCSAVVDGEIVVDIWGGFQDRGFTKPWQQDTLVNVYSTTKGIASLGVACLVEDELIDYDAPVAEIWPEFKAGQSGLTVGQFLSHQSGICGLREKIKVEDLYDWTGMIRRIADEEPHWKPGTAAGYHAVLWGFLSGEIVRRASGKTLGTIVRERIAEPLNADFFIGLPESEHHRVSDLIGPNHARIQPDMTEALAMKMPDLFSYALQNPSIKPFRDACSSAWRTAEIAAANGQANARGIARIYGALAMGGELEGVRIIKPETIEKMIVEEWGLENDLVLGRPMRRGRGVNLNYDENYGPNVDAFGHNGAGGSIGFADPKTKLGFGYAMNQMQPGIEADTRGNRLVKSVLKCVYG